MRKPIATALTVVAAFALATSIASARSGIGFDDTNATLTIARLSFNAGVSDITCSVTFDVTLHETVAKVSGSLVGQGDMAIGECSEGSMGLLVGGRRASEGGPYHVTYSSFAGTLPNIETANLVANDVTLWIQSGSVVCLTEGPQDILGTTTGGNPASGFSITSAGLRLDGDFPCDVSSATLSGSGTFDDAIGMTLLPTTATLTPSPASVYIEEDEEADSFVVRNVGNGTATITRVALTGVDTEAPELDVSAPGCGSTIAPNAACTYVVRPEERPWEGARYVIYYRDGVSEKTSSIPVTILGEDPRASLVGDPAGVAIGALEQSGIVEIRNEGDGATAAIDGVTATTTDPESPEFSVITSACGEALADEEACHLLISVNSRPEASGSITVEYDDNEGTGENRRLVIEVDVAGPDPAELEGEPTEVVIESLEANDSFVIRNISPDTAAVINRAILTSDDSERPEFSVTGFGCPEIFLAGASCTYVVAVNSRPEADGRYAIEYDDGAGNDRTVAVNVDIAS